MGVSMSIFVLTNRLLYNTIVRYMSIHSLHILTTRPSADYALLDSGEGEKLERYGSIVIARPDPQALWRKRLHAQIWQGAHAKFSRESLSTGWKLSREVPDRWEIELRGLRLYVKPTAFKHTGIFPEQAPNWEWITDRIEGKTCSVLNLFGYTGAASLVAAEAGAEVCHVDGSKVALTWARENALLSGLSEKPIRWILDDVRVFLAREVKRGRTYDALIMDPPAFGHGPNKELWKIEKDWLELLDLCKKVLSQHPRFVLMNGYAAGYSALTYQNNIRALMDGHEGNVEAGELTIAEEGSERLLPCGIFARWSSL